jgi:hypothetical protein
MSKTLPRKAVIAISSYNGAIYPGGHKTGLFFTEALHPFEVLVAAGFEVDLASETGTFGFDFNSLQPPSLSGSDKTVYNNPNHPFMVKLTNFAAQEGRGPEDGRVRSLLGIRRSLSSVRLPDGKGTADHCCAAFSVVEIRKIKNVTSHHPISWSTNWVAPE